MAECFTRAQRRRGRHDERSRGGGEGEEGPPVLSEPGMVGKAEVHYDRPRLNRQKVLTLFRAPGKGDSEKLIRRREGSGVLRNGR